MTREERKNMWENYLTDKNVIEAVFIGTKDLLSEEPSGCVYIHCHERGGRKETFHFKDGEYSALHNFNPIEEVYEVDTLWPVGDDYMNYIDEFLEDYKESHDGNISGLCIVNILKGGEFIWDYQK